MISGPELGRFWAKVLKTETCWLWTATKNPKGYGMFRTSYGVRPAHRIAYALANGEIAEGRLIDHTCHVRNCVNPGHLRAVTPKQNGENRKGVSKANRSGVRGVSWAKRHNKWIGLVGHQGQQVFVGYFDNIGAAEDAGVATRNTLHTHNNQDRIGA